MLLLRRVVLMLWILHQVLLVLLLVLLLNLLLNLLDLLLLDLLLLNLIVPGARLHCGADERAARLSAESRRLHFVDGQGKWAGRWGRRNPTYFLDPKPELCGDFALGGHPAVPGIEARG